MSMAFSPSLPTTIGSSNSLPLTFRIAFSVAGFSSVAFSTVAPPGTASSYKNQPFREQADRDHGEQDLEDLHEGLARDLLDEALAGHRAGHDAERHQRQQARSRPVVEPEAQERRDLEQVRPGLAHGLR